MLSILIGGHNAQKAHLSMMNYHNMESVVSNTIEGQRAQVGKMVVGVRYAQDEVEKVRWFEDVGKNCSQEVEG